MEAEATASSSAAPRPAPARPSPGDEEEVRMRRKTIRTFVKQCERALELLKNTDDVPDPVDGDVAGDASGEASLQHSPSAADYETDELHELLKAKVESPSFLEKLESIHMPLFQDISGADDSASWDMVSARDSWEDKHSDTENESEPDGFVLVNREDIVEGMACYMAAYLLSIEQAKEITPSKLQEVLLKTFSTKKRKSKLRKAWDGGKVIYNVASWSATAIGIYQNPALIRAASVALWSSCRIVSKLL